MGHSIVCRLSSDIDLNDPEVQKAATKIQAGFRGHMTRKEITTKTPDDKADADDIADIDLTDPGKKYWTMLFMLLSMNKLYKYFIENIVTQLI